MVIDESDGDEEADLSELPSPHSEEKRPSCSNQQPKQSKKKKGKMPFVDESIMNVYNFMTEKLGQHK